MQPRVQAYREVGWETSDDDDAYSNACQLERRLAIRERIAFHSHQAEQQIAEKRQRIEEALWNIHDADVADLFETIEVPRSDKDSKLETDETGKMLTALSSACRPRTRHVWGWKAKPPGVGTLAALLFVDAATDIWCNHPKRDRYHRWPLPILARCSL